MFLFHREGLYQVRFNSDAGKKDLTIIRRMMHRDSFLITLIKVQKGIKIVSMMKLVTQNMDKSCRQRERILNRIFSRNGLDPLRPPLLFIIIYDFFNVVCSKSYTSFSFILKCMKYLKLKKIVFL